MSAPKTETIVRWTNIETLSLKADELEKRATQVGEDAAWEDNATRERMLLTQHARYMEAVEGLRQTVDALKKAERVSYDLLYGRTEAYAA